MSEKGSKIKRNGIWYLLLSEQPCKFVKRQNYFSRYCDLDLCLRREIKIGKILSGARTGSKETSTMQGATTTVCRMKSDDVFTPEPKYGVVDFVDNSSSKAKSRRRLRAVRAQGIDVAIEEPIRRYR